MRGKTARAIRKEVGFRPNEVREYHTFMVDGMDNVMQYNQMTGEVTSVRRKVEKETVECVSGARKIYKYMKRKFYNVDHTEEFTKFPEQHEIKELTDTISQDMMSKTKADGESVAKKNESSTQENV